MRGLLIKKTTILAGYASRINRSEPSSMLTVHHIYITLNTKLTKAWTIPRPVVSLNSTGNTLLKVAAGVVSGAYSGYMAYQNGASKRGIIASGLVSAFGTTVSVANIAGWTGTNLSLGVSTMTDIVFGTSANAMGSVAYRVSTDSALLTTNHNSQKNISTNYFNRAKLVTEMELLY